MLSAPDMPKAWRLVPLPAPAMPRPAPTVHRAEVLVHRPLADRYRLLRLHAPRIAAKTLPGQFVMLTIAHEGQPAPVLPRPMAIYRTDTNAGTVDILYGVVGSGTARLVEFRVGEHMTIVGPLGRWFEIAPGVGSVLLIGRGIGTCSLTMLAQHARSRRVQVTAVASARHPDALIGTDQYRRAGVRVIHEVTDKDATSDLEALYLALTVELDNSPPELIATCGSTRLIGLAERLAGRWAGARVQVSIEAHMACGLGYCHGCASGARSEGEESPLICKDGPVFGWEPAPPVAGAGS
jgi:dihydroorotate dehydrogenase electron transfer subunit